MESFVLLGLLYGLTVAGIAFDRSRRRKLGRTAAKGEPTWATLLLLTVFLNVAALPHYLEQTRGTRLARWAGFGLFLVIFSLSFVAFLAVVLRGQL